MRERFKDHKIMNVVIIFLTIVFLGNAAAFAVTLADDLHGIEYEDYSLLSCVDRQDYAGLVQMMYSNEAYDVEPTETMKECYAVARYFELTSYDVAGIRKGPLENEAEYQAALEELRAQMGALVYAADDIDALLEAVIP